ncbi:MAG: glycosyltransferase family 9 protein [Planctomycetes bacterium]|nr:glycosyltransferase family 9 protein [Planctomycetota bacterium]
MATDPERRVLLVRLSALGDVVHALPALASLRAARPDAEIGWLVEDRNAGALEGHPAIDRLFVFRRAQGLAGVRALREELRAWRPDLSIDLQGNLKSGFLSRVSGAPRRIGLPPGEAREGAHLFATETVAPGPPREHRVDRAMRLVRPLGATIRRDGALPPVRPEAAAAVASALATRGLAAGGYAVLVPGTSAFGAFKRWPPAPFGAYAQRLRAERGVAVLVSFGPGERALAEAVVAASAGAASLAPETRNLHELIALLAGAAVVVGADCGPVAMAGVLGVETVALFGPKDPAIYRPPGPRVAVVWKQVYCSPCTLRRCGDPICMTTLRAEEVPCGGPERVVGTDSAPTAAPQRGY